MTSSTINAKIWSTSNASFTFPETAFQSASKKKLGVCFSGGGNRAYSAAIGQLRGLKHIKLLDKIDYISAVSGGSWATTVFMYADMPLDTLLGETQTNLQAIDLQTLKSSHQHYMGNCATINLHGVFKKAFETVPDHEVWIHTVGKVFLEPYGLNDPTRPFSLNDQSVDSAVNNNPSLNASSFYTVKPNRPFPIINGTLIWPENILEHENWLPFEYTPLYVGTAKQSTILSNNIPIFHTKRCIGNGYLESFAFKSSPPVQMFQADSQAMVRVPQPEKTFTLSEMIGSSSAFFAAPLDKLIHGKKFSPVFDYWPVDVKGKSNECHSYSIGDGSTIENYGILPLLRRQVENIIVFINTDDASNELNALITSFEQQMEKGESAIALKSYSVMDNTHIGISSKRQNGEPYKVNVLWVYNHCAKKWKAELNPSLQNAIKENHHGPFAHFPHYPATGADFEFFNPETWKDLGGLTIEQVNLLAHMSCWNVYNNASSFFILLST